MVQEVTAHGQDWLMSPSSTDSSMPPSHVPPHLPASNHRAQREQAHGVTLLPYASGISPASASALSHSASPRRPCGGGPVSGGASDVGDVRGLERVRRAYHRQHGGEPPRQHRLPRPQGPSRRRCGAERLAQVSLGKPTTPIVRRVGIAACRWRLEGHDGGLFGGVGVGPEGG
jgi:hypothetical protein